MPRPFRRGVSPAGARGLPEQDDYRTAPIAGQTKLHRRQNPEIWISDSPSHGFWEPSADPMVIFAGIRAQQVWQDDCISIQRVGSLQSFHRSERAAHIRVRTKDHRTTRRCQRTRIWTSNESAIQEASDWPSERSRPGRAASSLSNHSLWTANPITL